MADDSPIRDSNDDQTDVPRWVYMLGIIAIVGVLFVILRFSFGGPMGHGMQQP